MAAAAAPDLCAVLLVEDDDDTRDVMSRLLRRAGCDVREAVSAGEALVEQEVLRSVRRRRLPVKIAVVTAAGPMSDALAEASRWQPDAVFHKPVCFPHIEAWLAAE